MTAKVIVQGWETGVSRDCSKLNNPTDFSLSQISRQNGICPAQCEGTKHLFSLIYCGRLTPIIPSGPLMVRWANLPHNGVSDSAPLPGRKSEMPDRRNPQRIF